MHKCTCIIIKGIETSVFHYKQLSPLNTEIKSIDFSNSYQHDQAQINIIFKIDYVCCNSFSLKKYTSCTIIWVKNLVDTQDVKKGGCTKVMEFSKIFIKYRNLDFFFFISVYLKEYIAKNYLSPSKLWSYIYM